MQSNNIFLIGMMGAGKSTVGKIVAQRLDYDFVDMDVYIEQQANMSIPEIFETHGEKYFRTLEEKALAAIVREKEKSCVIATGGGCILSAKNRELMAKTGTRVFLKVDIDTLHTRLSTCYARPLAKSKTQMQEMYNERYEFYCDCDCIIDADDVLETVVDKIVEFLNMKIIIVTIPNALLLYPFGLYGVFCLWSITWLFCVGVIVSLIWLLYAWALLELENNVFIDTSRIVYRGIPWSLPDIREYLPCWVRSIEIRRNYLLIFGTVTFELGHHNYYEKIVLKKCSFPRTFGKKITPTFCYV